MSVDTNIMLEARRLVDEKGYHIDDVFFAMKEALLYLAQKQYGPEEFDIAVDPETGAYKLLHHCMIVANNPTAQQISLTDAQAISPDAKVGEMTWTELPFGNFAMNDTDRATTLLHSILSKLRKIREVANFRELIGENVEGVVKQIMSDGHIVLSLPGGGQGIIRKEHLIVGVERSDRYQLGESVQAYFEQLEHVKDDKIVVLKAYWQDGEKILQERTFKRQELSKLPFLNTRLGYQIGLSRTHNMFLAELMKDFVPELQSGELVIKAIARRAGKRAKVAVQSINPSMDPARLCIGQEGSRIKPIVQELRGERIDIIPYSDDPVSLATLAIKPAEVVQTVYRFKQVKNEQGEYEQKVASIAIVVQADQKKRAVGEKGLNIRLASSLTKIDLDILTLDEYKQRKIEITKFFEIELEVDREIAELLVNTGFESMDDLQKTHVEQISNVTNMTHDLVDELKKRAYEYSQRAAKFLYGLNATARELLLVRGLRTPYIRALVEANITSLEQLAKTEPEVLTQLLALYDVNLASATDLRDIAIKVIQGQLRSGSSSRRRTM